MTTQEIKQKIAAVDKRIEEAKKRLEESHRRLSYNENASIVTQQALKGNIKYE